MEGREWSGLYPTANRHPPTDTQPTRPLRVIQDGLAAQDADRFYFFNSFFFKKLTEKEKKPAGGAGGGGDCGGKGGKGAAELKAEKGHERVKKWTKVRGRFRSHP